MLLYVILIKQKCKATWENFGDFINRRASLSKHPSIMDPGFQILQTKKVSPRRNCFKLRELERIMLGHDLISIRNDQKKTFWFNSSFLRSMSDDYSELEIGFSSPPHPHFADTPLMKPKAERLRPKSQKLPTWCQKSSLNRFLTWYRASFHNTNVSSSWHLSLKFDWHRSRR